MNVTDGLTLQANLRPSAPAVLHDDRVIDFRTLEAATWRAVHWLARQGIAPGQVVGIAVDGNLAHLLTSLALARMGALQLNLASHEPMVLRQDMARRARAAVVIGDGPAAAEIGPPVLQPDPSWLATHLPVARDPRLRSPGGDRPWGIGASSGTTGRPKLYLYSHDTELARARRTWPRLAKAPGTRVLQLPAIGFFSTKRFHLSWIAAGHTSVFQRGARPPNGEAIVEAVLRLGIDVIAGTPLHFEQILAHCPPGAVRLPGRSLFIGSAVITEQLREAARSRIAARTLVQYGTNEAGLITLAEPLDQERHPGTVGRPVEGVELLITDEAGLPLPAGEAGLIRLRGPGITGRYLDDEQATARAWQDGWFVPGDVGALTADGALIFHGRADDMMNLDGLKVYPSEVETALLAHPAVAEAAAFPLAGSGGRQVPAAAVVLRRPLDVEALIAFGQERLGPRHPRRIVVLAELPRNGLGKVLKRELRARIEAEVQAR